MRGSVLANLVKLNPRAKMSPAKRTEYFKVKEEMRIAMLQKKREDKMAGNLQGSFQQILKIVTFQFSMHFFSTCWIFLNSSDGEVALFSPFQSSRG